MPNTVAVLKVLRGNRDPDAMVLWQLVKAGSDLSKPHEPDFMFETDKRIEAEAIAKELSALDYEVEIFAPDEERPKYGVSAKCVMLLELGTMNKITQQFETLARKYGAIYDGWGSEIVE